MKALMISRDASLHDEIAAQGAARMPVLRLLERRSGLRDAVERMLPEAPELVIVDASASMPTRPTCWNAWRASIRWPC